MHLPMLIGMHSACVYLSYIHGKNSIKVSKGDANATSDVRWEGLGLLTLEESHRSLPEGKKRVREP